MHFLTIGAIVRALGAHERGIATIHDIGCGTGVGGAAWALACDVPPSISGIDRNAWAVAEASWTYRQFQLRGTARTGDAVRAFPHFHISKSPHPAVLLAYAANELPDAQRTQLLDKVAAWVDRDGALLIVEPIARKDRGWWPAWAARLRTAGVVEHEWRFPANLPAALRQMAKAAGLDPRELTARTLSRL